MSYRKKFLSLLMSLILSASLMACDTKQNSDEPGETASDVANQTDDAGEGDMFTDRDLEVGYDESDAVVITLSDSEIASSDGSITIDGKTAVISSEGTYVIKGSVSGGQIIVNAEKTDKLHLVLDGVDISSENTAPIYIKQADKVVITLAADSENKLSVTGEYVNEDDVNIDSVIFSKEDLTLNGSGSLEISADYGHGIVSKDDLVITGGVYNITAEKHAISGKDSIRVADGVFTLNSGKDGLHAENTDDASLGFIYLAGGSFTINCDGDGMDAAAYLKNDGADINVTSGGGCEQGETHTDDVFGGGRPDMMGGGMNAASETASTDTDNTTSTKGIKSNGDMTLTAGSFTADCADDAVHSNGNILITGGSYFIRTGDDGIHADGSVTITGGVISVEYSYEGVEGVSIEISGGEIDVISSDDGFNVAGGNDQSGFGGRVADVFAENSDSYIKISGGTININADGDGLDSNGSVYVTGGECYVAGPDNGGNGALDYAGSAEISGGLLIAVGASQMAQSFSSSSTQCSAMVNISEMTSGTVVLKDSDGNVLASFSPNKNYNSVVVSCADMKTGETYTLTAGDTDCTVEMTAVTVTVGSGATGGMMPGEGFGGDMQNRGNMRQPTDGDMPSGDMTPPDMQNGINKSEGEAV